MKQHLTPREQEKITHVWWDKEQCEKKCDRHHPDGCWVLHVNGQPVYDAHWSPVILREK